MELQGLQGLQGLKGDQGDIGPQGIKGDSCNIMPLIQNGKVIQREFSALELSKSSNSRGQALISTQRLEQGVRFAGSVPFTSGTYIAMLESTGRVGFYSVDLMCQSGRLQVNGDCISLALFAYSAGQSKKYES